MDENLNIAVLVTAIREIAGDTLDRVVLYGSYIYGGWSPESSDVDVAVLLQPLDLSGVAHSPSQMLGVSQKRCADIKRSLFKLQSDRNFGELTAQLAFYVEDADIVERLRDFTPCMESKLLCNGRVLWSATDAHQYEALPVDEARRHVIERGMRAALCIIDRARHDCLVTELITRDWHGRQCNDAHTAACMCLRAMLYQHDIDPSDRSLRWIVSALIYRLKSVLPEAASLAKYADKLPDRFCRDYLVDDATRKEARAAIAAALHICRFASRVTCYWDRPESIATARAHAAHHAKKLEGSTS
jgi:predicted nucleotidyltransferase